MEQKPVIAAIAPLKILSDGTVISEDTPEDVVFYSGWQPTTQAVAKDIDESLRVARLIRAARGQCWFNARKAILRLAEYAEASYVEGWAVARRTANRARVDQPGRHNRRSDLA